MVRNCIKAFSNGSTTGLNTAIRKSFLWKCDIWTDKRKDDSISTIVFLSFLNPELEKPQFRFRFKEYILVGVTMLTPKTFCKKVFNAVWINFHLEYFESFYIRATIKGILNIVQKDSELNIYFTTVKIDYEII